MTDRLFEGDRCALCGGERGGVIDHDHWSKVLGGYSFCLVCSKQYDGVASQEIDRRRKQSAPGGKFKAGDLVIVEACSCGASTCWLVGKPWTLKQRDGDQWATAEGPLIAPGSILRPAHPPASVEGSVTPPEAPIARPEKVEAVVPLPRCDKCGGPCGARGGVIASRDHIGVVRVVGHFCGMCDPPGACRHERRFRSGLCCVCGHVGPGENDAGYAITGTGETDAEAVARRERVRLASESEYPPLANLDEKVWGRRRGTIDQRIAAARRSIAEESEAKRPVADAHPRAWPAGSYDDVNELAVTEGWSGR